MFRAPAEMLNRLLGFGLSFLAATCVQAPVWTKQLQAYSKYAQAEGKAFQLFVRESTILSKKVEQMAREGYVTIRPIMPW